MKKNLLFIVAITFLATSCLKDETILVRQEEKPVIGFNSISDRMVKSTGEITIASLDEFYVDAYYYTTTADYTVATTKYFNGVEVTSDDAGVCTYSPVKYWPETEKLDFFAYKGLTLGTPTVATEMPISFTVADAAASQVDAVVSQALNPTRATNVHLNFHHALSQIKFAARSGVEGVKFDVTGIELVYVQPSGSTKLGSSWTPVSPATTTGNGLVWTASGTQKDYAAGLASNTNIPYSTTDWTNITAADGALMLIPQSLTAGASGTTPETDKSYIKVTYVAKDATTGVSLTPSSVYYIGLGGTSADWKAGVRYTYRISFNSITPLGLDPIVFDATVEGWVENATDVII